MSVLMDLDRTRMPLDFADWYGSHLEKVSSARATVEQIVGRRLPPVAARLVRSTQLGAEALRARNTYEIRLTAALPAILHFTFNCLLRTPHYMYGVGQAEQEVRYRHSSSRVPLSLPRGVRIEEAIVAITTLSRPRDDRRAATAVLMTELAVAFCAYHELAHILLGHVDAYRQQSGRASLLEVAESERAAPALNAKTRLVWEYEADLVAGNMLLQDMVSRGAETAFEDAYGERGETDAVARVQAMLGAVLVVFLLMAQVTPAKRLTHPDPLVRFAAVANDGMAALSEQQPQLGLGGAAAEETVNEVAVATLDAWAELGLRTSAASPLKKLLTAQRDVERLELVRLRGHAAYSHLASFYPFKTEPDSAYL